MQYPVIPRRGLRRQFTCLAIPLATALAVSAMSLGCQQGSDSEHGAVGAVGARRLPIVNGQPANDPAVVIVINAVGGGLCTGSLIAPRVVLTAKHCVQRSGATEPDDPRVYSVGVGNNVYAQTQSLRVAEVRTTPGSYSLTGGFGLDGALVGQDVGVLILAQPVNDIDPIPFRRDRPEDQVGEVLRVVGFGQTPSGSVGEKLATTTTATMLTGGVMYTGTSTCQGDSGGPIMQSDGKIIGVTSFGNGACGLGFAAYNLLPDFLNLIDQAVADSGACIDNGDEVCDGFDNDCDDAIDETCLGLGETCASDDECAGQTCAKTTAGDFCSAPCDLMLASTGCGPGFFCAKSDGCQGLCLPLVDAGELDNGEPCSTSVQCRSRFCDDPGDGQKRCLDPCKGGEGICFAGEACAAAPGSCGGCVDADLITSGLSLGEPCGASTDCLSGQCFDEGGYCTQSCSNDSDCAQAFHCRESQCVRGTRGGVGALCVKNSDCQDGGVCATKDELKWCTVTCAADGDCPAAFSCFDAGNTKVCAPTKQLIGESCSDDSECVTGVCIKTSGGSACSKSCGPTSICDTSLACVRGDDGGYCVPPGTTLPKPSNGGGGGGGGGCAVAPSEPGETGALCLFAAVWLAARRRRRRAHAVRGNSLS